MPLIEPGQPAPDFTLRDQNGNEHSLKKYAGRPVVLYFYPKDDTPGCTTETCDFRDNLPRFETANAAVLGVSILEFRGDKVARETIYTAEPWDAPDWRKPWRSAP